MSLELAHCRQVTSGGRWEAVGVAAEAVTDAAEMLDVLTVLSSARCAVWVAGGWGVDVLVGRQTRGHRDLDLAVDQGDLDRALTELAGLGYVAEMDWLPVRVELHRPGRGRVDLHPVAFDAQGDGVQAGLAGHVFRYPHGSFVTGSLAGRPVPCLSRELQLAFRHGYEHRDIDRHDLAKLIAQPPTSGPAAWR